MWRKCIVHFVSMALRHQIKSCCIDKFHCHIEKNNSLIFQFENRVFPLPKFCDKSKIHACHIIHQVLYNFKPEELKIKFFYYIFIKNYLWFQPLISLAWTGRCGLRLWAATSTTPGLFTWSTDWWLDSERSWSWSSTIHSPTNRQSSLGPSSTTTTLQDKPRKINGTCSPLNPWKYRTVNSLLNMRNLYPCKIERSSLCR